MYAGTLEDKDDLEMHHKAKAIQCLFIILILLLELYYITYLYSYVCFIPLMSQYFILPLVCDAFLSHFCSLNVPGYIRMIMNS